MNRVLGPQALAVVSCALALLAAQPLTTPPTPAQSAAHDGSVVIRSSITVNPFVRYHENSTYSRTSGRLIRHREESFLASARQFHILATVEILHRLLAYELRPLEHPLPAVLFQPLCLLTLATPITTLLPRRSHAAPTLSMERQFALHHCLLAPPVS